MSDFGADIFDQDPTPPKPAGDAGKPPARRRRKAVAEPSPEPDPETAAEAPADGVEARPRRKRRGKAVAAAEPTAEAATGAEVASEALVEDAGAAEAKPPARSRRRRKPAEDESAPATAAAAPAPAPAPVPAPAPAPVTLGLSRWTQRLHGSIEPPHEQRHARVAVLLDLHHLQEAARSRGAELSFRKLLRNLAGERRVLRAVCYLLRDAPKPAAAAIAASGFEVQLADTDAEVCERMQRDAATLPSGVETLVLAPGTEAQLDLRQQLDPELRIELANFEPAGSMGLQHRQLGRECVFVP